LADKGYDPVYGARPLKRAVQRYLETAIAKEILRGRYQPGDRIRVTVEGDRLVFEQIPLELLKL